MCRNVSINLNLCYNTYMLNRVDKCFFISLIIMLINLVIVFLLTVGIPVIYLNDLFKISNYIINIIVLFILPICIITQIIVLSIKIISKNKILRDWIIILINFLSVLFFGLITTCLIGSLINPLI